MMDPGNIPMACYLPVGGPEGKPSGSARRGTNENRSCPSRTSMMSVGMKALELRFGESCGGTNLEARGFLPLVKVTSHTDTVASLPSL